MFELLGSKFLRNENQTDPENGIRSQEWFQVWFIVSPGSHVQSLESRYLITGSGTAPPPHNFKSFARWQSWVVIGVRDLRIIHVRTSLYGRWWENEPLVELEPTITYKPWANPVGKLFCLDAAFCFEGIFSPSFCIFISRSTARCRACRERLYALLSLLCSCTDSCQWIIMLQELVWCMLGSTEGGREEEEDIHGCSWDHQQHPSAATWGLGGA